MNCSSPGATHHLACDCREAEFAAELVAADHCRATADRALYAERCRVVDLEKKLAAAEEKGMAWERACEMAVMERDGARKAAQTYHDKLAAAEERARRLEEALRAEALLLAAAAGIQAVAEEAGRTTKASEVYQYLAFRLALLAPPPEAEKRGEG